MSYNPTESLLPTPSAPPPIHVMAGGGNADVSLLDSLDPQLKQDFLEQTAEGSPCLESSGNMSILSAKCAAIPKVLRAILRKKIGLSPVPEKPVSGNEKAEPKNAVIEDGDVVKNPADYRGDDSGFLTFSGESDPASTKPIFGNASLDGEKYRIKGTSVENVVKKYQTTRKQKPVSAKPSSNKPSQNIPAEGAEQVAEEQEQPIGEAPEESPKEAVEGATGETTDVVPEGVTEVSPVQEKPAEEASLQGPGGIPPSPEIAEKPSVPNTANNITRKKNGANTNKNKNKNKNTKGQNISPEGTANQKVKAYTEVPTITNPLFNKSKLNKTKKNKNKNKGQNISPEGTANQKVKAYTEVPTTTNPLFNKSKLNKTKKNKKGQNISPAGIANQAVKEYTEAPMRGKPGKRSRKLRR